MTRTFEAHFDGKSLVPEKPVDLPTNQRLIVNVEAVETSDQTEHGTVEYFMKHFTSTISDEDAELMRRAIDDADKNSEPSPDVNLD